MEAWYLPITIIPGIGLLILSTSNLIISLNEELEGLLKDADEFQLLIDRKLSQMKLLTYSLAGLYLSTALLVLSGLLSFSKRYEEGIFSSSASVSLITGVTLIFISLIILILYSVRAVTIRRAHFDECLMKEK
ncbi:MAG: hypothetical protein MK198_14565 [Gracilimonas sp.]|uniref:hypothetical protein n=1 Tax=Gracilimonas sp. TaxID=1974203 RepID=UPI0037518619|nr:hypothetical protein [Gracilimonas sp.]